MLSWKVLSSRPLVSRPPWLRLWEEDVRLPNGEVIQGYLRSQSRDYATVFALLEDGTVPMVSQYKHGKGGVSLDLPAGYLDSAGEPPLTAARRELEEETGVTAAVWQSIGDLVVDSNRGSTRCHLFLARGAVRDGSQHLDTTEDLTVSFHLPSELSHLVLSGRIDSIGSVAGILMALRLLEGREECPSASANSTSEGLP
jgi:8-oxo-dGTP pyrophosphatase MutT (NUDIX family)